MWYRTAQTTKASGLFDRIKKNPSQQTLTGDDYDPFKEDEQELVEVPPTPAQVAQDHQTQAPVYNQQKEDQQLADGDAYLGINREEENPTVEWDEEDQPHEEEEIEGTETEHKHAISTRNLSVSYDGKEVLHDINLDIPRNEVTALIGPSGCGKSTFLRALNRMNDLIPNNQVKGTVLFNGNSVYDPNQDITKLRSQIGMIAQKPNPFPMSIYDNVAYGLRIAGLRNPSEIKQRVEAALQDAGIWEEVKDRLKESAMKLSGGQQQRLCIARAIAVNPKILLMDEPCSALDPLATKTIEALITKLKEKYTIVIVTHNMAQAARVSDQTAMFYDGTIEDSQPTESFFKNPKTDTARSYISGEIG